MTTAVLVLTLAHCTFGDDRKPYPIPNIAKYVPADTGLLVYSDRILATDVELHEDGIFQLMLKLSGGSPVGWKGMLAQSLGLDSNAALREILKERLAIAAPDWDHLENGVIIVDQYNKRLLQLVTGRGRIKNQEKDNDVNIFQTPGGMWVAANKRILILSQRTGGQSLFRRCARLLAGSNKQPLAADRMFRSCVTSLPRESKACLYWSDDAKRANAKTPLWEVSKNHAIGLQGRQNVLEVTHVGTVNSNGVEGYRPRVKFQQVRQLPQTTLVSWSTSIHWREFLSDPNLSPMFVDLLKIVGVFGENGQADIREDIVANLGPRCTIIIGADFADKNLRPSAAILVESVDSQAIATAIDKYIGDQVESERSPEATENASAKIRSIALPNRPAAARGNTVGALIAQDFVPSYAAIDGWFVVSSSPQHAQEIIEAGQGKSPRLEDVLPIHAHAHRVKRATDLVLVQPSFLHGILQFWESQLISQTGPKRNDSRLGIEIQKEVSRGQVVVVNVDSNGVAAGKLVPGDRIVACNAILLNLENPNKHLKDMLAAVQDSIVLRVVRGDDVLDVSIPKPIQSAPSGSSRIDELLAGAEPFQSLFLNSTIALYIKERPADGLAVTRLAIELNREGMQSKPQEAGRTGSP